MKKLIVLFSLVTTPFFAQTKLADGMYATFTTDKGVITTQLYYQQTPLTVANFISLAEGKHPEVKNEYKGKLYYNGLKFHRVIPNFMIQGGDPKGDGSGEPGYLFPDEIVKDLKHDAPGVLSMANRGVATNGSQFFITHNATPWLDGKHTVFGKVIEGQNIVDAIQQNDEIKKVEIIRVGKDAKKFDAPKIYKTTLDKIKKEEVEKKAKAEVLAQKAKLKFDNYKNLATSLPSGVKVYVEEKGAGIKPQPQELIKFDYAGFLTTGKLFDTGIETLAAEHGIFDQNRKNANAYQPLDYNFGEQSTFIKGMIEGLLVLNKGDKAYIFIPADLGYGSRDMGVIPANSDLIFYVDIKN